jgi:ABC-type Na+ efflux pump permease subunit
MKFSMSAVMVAIAVLGYTRSANADAAPMLPLEEMEQAEPPTAQQQAASANADNAVSARQEESPPPGQVSVPDATTEAVSAQPTTRESEPTATLSQPSASEKQTAEEQKDEAAAQNSSEHHERCQAGPIGSPSDLMSIISVLLYFLPM